MVKTERRMFYISPEIWNSLIKKGFNISKLVRDYLTEIDARNLKPIDLFSPKDGTLNNLWRGSSPNVGNDPITGRFFNKLTNPGGN